jgi:uncharacterized protein YbbC (DUF1343 family)
MKKVLTGLDRLKSENIMDFQSARLGLLSNQASIDSQFIHAKEIISESFPGQLKALFGPQHGYGGEDQDNMIETGHSLDKGLKIPVFSLYSDSRTPLPEMLDLIDVLIIDLQDVGTRVYTFASTMLNCLKAAKSTGKKVVVLDRPNPLGGEILEGNILKPELYSFVGPFGLPMRHGLTMGELAEIFNKALNIGCDLKIVPMKGWAREMLWPETGLTWAMPSPNMPLVETSFVYPGQVIWEGTNISEGRGTCRPFEIFGAPFLKTEIIKERVPKESVKGCYLREISFKPTFNKWEGQICRGFMIHILDNRLFRPYLASVTMLKTIIETHGDDFDWKRSPYEYVYDKLPIDVILGNSDLRKDIERGNELSEINRKYLSEYKEFTEWRRSYLLY